MCFNEAKVADLRSSLPGLDDTARLAEALKAVGHPGRLAVFQLLAREECCVCDIAHTLEQPVSTVSQHLQRLRRAGLVRSRKQGKWVFYRPTDSAVARLLADAREEAL
jgi:ArsR family transcriptional regulator